ncbi:cytochrome P450 [Aspergillus carlsbadensis]|nr:cytochrome P450 [Aspergillus carlsbadensis]
MVQDIGCDQPELPVNIAHWASRAVLELSGLSVFGQDPGWLARYPDLAASLERRVATGHVRKIVLAIFPRPIRSLLMLTLFGRQELADLKCIEDAARDLARIEMQKQAAAVRSNKLPQTTGIDYEYPPQNVISAILQDPDSSLSEEEIIGHILIFLVGASETTSASFQWMILELCRHPDVQTRLRREVQSHWPSLQPAKGAAESHLLFSRIKSLPYLRAVVDEVLRLHPAVVLTEHEATQQTTIAGTLIPKGTLLLCPPLAANLNPRVWGCDAGGFNPERFLLANANPSQKGESGRYYCANMTFSHGPRSCPGQSIARLMLACLTATFVHSWVVSLDDPRQPYVPTEAVYARPMPDLRVRLVKVLE